MFVVFIQFLDHRPCIVFTAVVDKQDKTVFRNFIFIDQPFQYACKLPGRFSDNAFLVVARHDNRKSHINGIYCFFISTKIRKNFI